MILWSSHVVEVYFELQFLLARDWGPSSTATVGWEPGLIEPRRDSGWTMIPEGREGLG